MAWAVRHGTYNSTSACERKYFGLYTGHLFVSRDENKEGCHVSSEKRILKRGARGNKKKKKKRCFTASIDPDESGIVEALAYEG